MNEKLKQFDFHEDDLTLRAYYYSFEPTGVVEVDRLLQAVARAGKQYRQRGAVWRTCSTHCRWLRRIVPVVVIVFISALLLARMRMVRRLIARLSI